MFVLCRNFAKILRQHPISYQNLILSFRYKPQTLYDIDTVIVHAQYTPPLPPSKKMKKRVTNAEAL